MYCKITLHMPSSTRANPVRLKHCKRMRFAVAFAFGVLRPSAVGTGSLRDETLRCGAKHMLLRLTAEATAGARADRYSST
jgi:hypothetical protein